MTNDLIENFTSEDLIYGMYASIDQKLIKELSAKHGFCTVQELMYTHIISNFFDGQMQTYDKKIISAIKKFDLFTKEYNINLKSYMPFNTIITYSKACIFWTAMNNNKIHFVLTDLHQPYVIFKNHPKERQIKNELKKNILTKRDLSENSSLSPKTYVGSELRFIARYWDVLKNTVIFWDGNPLKQVKPPFFDENEIKIYDEKTEQKQGFLVSEIDKTLTGRPSFFWKEYQQNYKSKALKDKSIPALIKQTVEKSNCDSHNKSALIANINFKYSK